MEILFYNISTKRSSNQAPFDKISKSGDGGGSSATLVEEEKLVHDCSLPAEYISFDFERSSSHAESTYTSTRIIAAAFVDSQGILYFVPFV